MSDEKLSPVTRAFVGAAGVTEATGATLSAVTVSFEGVVQNEEARRKLLTPGRRMNFEELTEAVVRARLDSFDPENMNAAIAWLKEKEDGRAREARLRHKQLFGVARRTFWAAVAAVVVGVVGVIVTVAIAYHALPIP